MAVVNTKSETITALDATPREVAQGHKHAGILKISKDTAEVAAIDDDLSVYRLVRIPSNACIKELNITNDAIAGGLDYDLGVYQVPDEGSAVVNRELFSSAISMVTARTLPLNALFEAGIDIANGDQLLWELLGLSADPFRSYDICITAVTVGSAAGTVGVECVWSQ